MRCDSGLKTVCKYLEERDIKNKMVPSSNYWYDYGIRTPLMNPPLL